MDVVTLALAKKYTDSKLNTGMYVGTVPPGGSFPTTRLDGSALQNEDFVKPLMTATFPYTVGTVEFTNKFTEGLYLNGTWVSNPGAIQDTSETPLKSSASESIGGTSATQKELNEENKGAILNRVEKTNSLNIVYGTDGAGAQTEISHTSSNVNGSIVQRSSNGTAEFADPISAQDAATKNYVGSTFVPKQHDVSKNGMLLDINSSGQVDYKDPSDLTPVWGNITGTLANQTDLSDELALKVKYTDVIDNVTSTSTNLPLSAHMGKELQDQISSLSSMGRFLSAWNCRFGVPGTEPTVIPYNYKTGDYYIVSVVATEGGTNYKPYGSQYTGTASTMIEAGEIHENDFYQYDGSTWIKYSRSAQTVTFSSISGDPYSNTNLATALNSKYVKPATGIPYSDLASDALALYRKASEQDVIDATKVDKVAGKGLSTDDFDEDLYYNKVSVDAKLASITATFRGSFATHADLLAYSGAKNKNDYAYVEADETHSGQKWRYTYDGTDWVAEYRLDSVAVWGTISGSIEDQNDLFVKFYKKTEVDEKISSSAATFRGSFATKAELIAYAGDKQKNDYAVVLADESHSEECWRYKYSGTAWLSEYRVNETAITSEQYAAMNSGITSSKVTTYDSHGVNTSNPHNVTKSQIGLGDVNNTADVDKPISTATQTALDTKITNPAGGTAGKILKKTASGEEWADQYPSGTTGEVLSKTADGVAFTVTCPTRVNSKAYTLGTKVAYPGNLYILKCNIAGTTAATLPALPADIQSGVTELSDGTVTWVIYDVTATGEYVPQLSTFPEPTSTSPLSFQYIGEEAGYNQFSHYKKVVEAYCMTCSFGTFYSMTEPPDAPASCQLYDDAECTVLNADYTANNNGAQIIVTKVSTSETASASLAGGSHYEEIESSVDAYTKTESDARYLQLSGGKITGLLKVKDGGGAADGIRTDVDNSQLMICGGTDNTGATLWLNGKNRSAEPGCFNIRAMKDSTTCDLFGGTDGKLYWCGQELFNETSGDGRYLKLSGGTMTGPLTVKGGYNSICSDDASKELYVHAGPEGTQTSGSLLLRVPIDSENCSFSLRATDPSGLSCSLYGYGNGKLVWGSSYVALKPSVIGPEITASDGWTLWHSFTQISGDLWYFNGTFYNGTGAAQGSADLVVATIKGHYPLTGAVDDCALATACFEAPTANIGCVIQTNYVKFRCGNGAIPNGAYIPITGVIIWHYPA